jgi:hypothetical protein
MDEGRVSEQRWLTLVSLSDHEKLFLLGTFYHISMYIGEGDFSRYRKFVERGIVQIHEYNDWNRHVSLTWRGEQMARELRRTFEHTWYQASDARHKEYKLMLYGDEFMGEKPDDTSFGIIPNHPQRPPTPPPQPMLRIGGDGHPTLSEIADKYDELHKGTLSYQAVALRESVIVLGKAILTAIADAIGELILFISRFVEQFMVDWVEYDEQKPKPSTEPDKYISVEDIARVLYLRTPFNREDCEMLAPYILTIDAIDKLEFAICAANLGVSPEKVLWSLKYNQYSSSIVLWRQTQDPKYWDCQLSALNFENPKDLLSDNVLVRQDGEILVIEDAPPVEMLGKRKNG